MKVASQNNHHDMSRTLQIRGGSLSLLKLIVLVTVALVAIGGIRRANHARESRTALTSNNDLFTRELEEIDSNCTLDCCQAWEEDICGGDSENAWIAAIPFAVQILLIVVLISLSSLFSGLTLGLLSLDTTGLEIVMSGDDPDLAAKAKAIYPVRQDGNLLLCTLVLGNVMVNALLSILMAEYTGGIIGLFSSTMLIVIFGEISPQAICARHALTIGSKTVPIVRVILFIMYPVAKPLAYCLDRALGAELATIYSNAEMMKLFQIHVQHNAIDAETAGAMTGALTYKNIMVKEVMTPIDQTFMLHVDEKLSFETIAKIFKTGFSRIPIYEITKDNIIGLLFVKDLIFLDPEDEIPIRNFVQIFGRGVHVVWPDDKLGDVLAELKKGSSHLAIVRDVNNTNASQDPFYEVKGIITLEDIIEKIIGDTIVDETDEYVDSTRRIKVDRAENFEWARLRLLDAKIVDELLSPDEVKAVTAHLRMNYASTVQLLTDNQLFRLVATTPVSYLETAKHELGNKLPDDLLYKKGEPSDICTLILSGKVTILVGAEDFRSDLSSWSVLGKAALDQPEFCPDFTAFVSDGPCRCLRISHSAFATAVDSSAVERTTAETKVRNRSPSFNSNDGGNDSVGESISVASNSSTIPNRRKKWLDQLFKEGKTHDAIGEEVHHDDKEGIVRFKETATDDLDSKHGDDRDSVRTQENKLDDVVTC